MAETHFSRASTKAAGRVASRRALVAALCLSLLRCGRIELGSSVGAAAAGRQEDAEVGVAGSAAAAARGGDPGNTLGTTTASSGAGGSSPEGGADSVALRRGAGGAAATSGAGGSSPEGGAPTTVVPGGAGGRDGSSGAAGTSASAAAAGMTGTDARTAPSCGDSPARCGSAKEDCCTSIFVPAGMVTLGGDLVTPSCSGYVSSFYLDKYEVTVQRFRKFLEEYDAWIAAGNPRESAGQHEVVPDSGWHIRWNSALPPTAAELEAEIDAEHYSTLRDAQADPRRPVNEITWFEAFAFCIWDGGRLPTEMEWEYTAAGGDEQRRYPWGSIPDPNDPAAGYLPDYAVYGCFEDGGVRCTLAPVGSAPLGAGRWGHLDLAGSAAEWVLDSGAEYPEDTCSNYANLSSDLRRMFRGGDWTDTGPQLQTASRAGADPMIHAHIVGVRCARNQGF